MCETDASKKLRKTDACETVSNKNMRNGYKCETGASKKVRKMRVILLQAEKESETCMEPRLVRS